MDSITIRITDLGLEEQVEDELLNQGLHPKATLGSVPLNPFDFGPRYSAANLAWALAVAPIRMGGE